MNDDGILTRYKMLLAEKRGIVNAVAHEAVEGLRRAGIMVPPINGYNDVRFHLMLESLASWALDNSSKVDEEDAAAAPLARGRSRGKSNDHDDIEREHEHSGERAHGGGR